MKAIQNKSRWSWLGIPIVAVGLAVALPPVTVQADDDDDWEDRWEDYEDWREDRDDAYEDWRDDRGRRYRWPDGGYRVQHYPDRYYYDHRTAPGYRSYYWEPRRYGSYDRYPYYDRYPRYRDYGTLDVGYTEYGRERSVRVGPFRAYWYR